MTNSPSLQPNPPRILVIAMRFLGDVLLTTPLIHSLKQAYPDARIDVLVYRNTAGMLEGNLDIHQIITTPNRPKFADYRHLLRQLFRRYDLAVATQSGDRPFLYTLLASPLRVAVVPPKNTTGWWKRFFVQHWVEFDDNTHTVLQHLKLLDSINVPQYFSLIPPTVSNARQLAEQFLFLSDNTSYVVLHTHPQWPYKQWTVAAWIKVGHYLNDLGLTLVLSGGPAHEEIDYVAAIQRQLPEGTINLAGRVTLAELARIIGQAKLYIGPDTGITHLAAATGIPVIALFGPTNPVKWAPFPYAYQTNVNPFNKKGDQHVNNIYLVQGVGDCVPCDLEGCDRHRLSHSDCLSKLSAEKVLALALSIVQKEN